MWTALSQNGGEVICHGIKNVGNMKVIWTLCDVGIIPWLISEFKGVAKQSVPQIRVIRFA